MPPTFHAKNIAERALWTFLQAALGSISVVQATTAVTGGHVGALRVAGLTALGAGVAAVLSLAKNLTAEGIVVQSVQRAAVAAAPSTSGATLAPTTVAGKPAKP